MIIFLKLPFIFQRFSLEAIVLLTNKAVGDIGFYIYLANKFPYLCFLFAFCKYMCIFQPLLVPRPNRPLYTDSMSGVRIALSGLSTKNCREAVDLVHFMGGSAQRVFSASTTHLITDAARGKTYRVFF